MATARSAGSGRESAEFVPGSASDSVVSLSQAILAPLDAISKAQIHAARSFLNFVLQIGYPHRPWRGGAEDAQAGGAAEEDNRGDAGAGEPMYAQRFVFEQAVSDAGGAPTRRTVEVSVPTLALVPVQPLGIDKAQYDIELVISHVERHRQIQASEQAALKREAPAQPAAGGGEGAAAHQPRPWYLVPDPISVRGTLSDPGGAETGNQRQASVRVHVEVKSVDVPAGLSKLIGAMTQIASIGTPGAGAAATGQSEPT